MLDQVKPSVPNHFRYVEPLLGARSQVNEEQYDSSRSEAFVVWYILDGCTVSVLVNINKCFKLVLVGIKFVISIKYRDLVDMTR